MYEAQSILMVARQICESLVGEEIEYGHAKTIGYTLERAEGGIGGSGLDAVERYAVHFEDKCEFALGKALFHARLGNAKANGAAEIGGIFGRVSHGLSLRARILPNGRKYTTVSRYAQNEGIVSRS